VAPLFVELALPADGLETGGAGTPFGYSVVTVIFAGIIGAWRSPVAYLLWEPIYPAPYVRKMQYLRGFLRIHA